MTPEIYCYSKCASNTQEALIWSHGTFSTIAVPVEISTASCGQQCTRTKEIASSQEVQGFIESNKSL